MVYVGETDDVGDRMRQHNREKEFWDRACLITSKDQNLTKARVRYLESRLISIVQANGRAKLLNGNVPPSRALPEADIADMEFFIEQAGIVLPALGMDFLRPAAPVRPNLLVAPVTSREDDRSPVFEITSKKHDLRGEGREIEGDFVVLAGSQVQGKWIGSGNSSYLGIYHQLRENGVLTGDPQGSLHFATDYALKSPSAASSVILGRASNGRTEWRVKGTNKTYAAWQDEQIAAVSQP